jgi:hypothetical protein
MNLLIAALIVISLTVLLLCLGEVARRLAERRVSREMAAFACPFCMCQLGLKAVAKGRDYSPFEVLWAVDGALVHCHPICRRIKCEKCGECIDLRLNREGERFGARLSSENCPEKKAAPEVIAELRGWIADHRSRAQPGVPPDRGGIL